MCALCIKYYVCILYICICIYNYIYTYIYIRRRERHRAERGASGHVASPSKPRETSVRNPVLTHGNPLFVMSGFWDRLIFILYSRLLAALFLVTSTTQAMPFPCFHRSTFRERPGVFSGGRAWNRKREDVNKTTFPYKQGALIFSCERVKTTCSTKVTTAPFDRLLHQVS